LVAPRVSATFRSFVKSHQGRGSSPFMKRVIEINTSSTQGSWRDPVFRQSFSYISKGHKPMSCCGSQMPSNRRSLAPAGPIFGRFVSSLTLLRSTLLGFMMMDPNRLVPNRRCSLDFSGHSHPNSFRCQTDLSGPLVRSTVQTPSPKLFDAASALADRREMMTSQRGWSRLRRVDSAKNHIKVVDYLMAHGAK
jgi:hypothetical protein